MSQALIVRNDAALTVSYTEAALALKSHALEVAALVGRVSSEEENQAAVAAQKEIAGILKQAEDSRKQAKEPILDFGRAIDEAANRFKAELKDEELRLGRLTGDYQALQQAKARAAELARIAEQRKLEEERRQAEQKIIEERLAAQRKLDAEAAEIARKEREAKNKEEAARLELERLELERQRKLAEAKSHQELDKINDRHAEQVAAIPVVAPVRATGQVVTNDWEITVTDLHLLYRCHANCVELKPRLSEIKNLLKLGVKVQGVKADPVVKAGVRATKQRAAIDV